MPAERRQCCFRLQLPLQASLLCQAGRGRCSRAAPGRIYMPALISCAEHGTSLDDASTLGACRRLSDAAAFRYLRQSGVYELSDVDDAQEFRLVCREAVAPCSGAP